MSDIQIHRCGPREIYKHMGLALRAKLVPFVRSSPGMGKSSIVKKLAKDMNLKLIDHRLSTSEPTDMSGLPKIENGESIFAPFKGLFPTDDLEVPEGFAGWLLFLDEFNSADKAVLKAAYKLILDRMVGQRKLHPKVYIVCAGNLDTDKAIVTSIGTAMQSRVIHLEMELNFEQWYIDVAVPNDYDSRITAFLHAFNSRLMDFNPDHDDKTFCCPRTWEFMNAIVKEIDGEIEDEYLPIMAGTITSGVAAEFLQYTKVAKNMTTIDQVVANPDNCPIPSDNSLIWATSMHLLEKIDENNFEDVLTYMNRMRASFKIVFYRSLITRHPDATQHPAYRKGVMSIASLL